MQNNCHLGGIASINKILSDSLTAASGHQVESMKYLSCNISEFNENITDGVIIIFKDEQPIQIEFCNHVGESIERFVKNNTNIQNIGIGIIYDVQNTNSQTKALRMIENYLGLIFKLD